MVPGFDVRAARITWTVIAVLGAAWLLYQLRSVFFILLLSLFFAYLLIPVIDFADRLRPPRLSRRLTLVVVYLLVLLAIGTALASLGSRLAAEAGRLEEQLPALQAYATKYLSGALPEDIVPWQRHVIEFLRKEILASAERVVPLAREFGTRVLGWLGSALTALLVPIFAFFFLLEGHTLIGQLLSRLPRDSQAEAHSVLRDIDVFLGAYIRALLLLALATFIVTGSFFAIAGVPYALLLAAIGGLLEVIPVLGPLLSAMAAIAVALLSGYPHVPLLAGFLLGWRLVQDYVLQPRVFGAGIKLNPLLILIGVYAGEKLAGIPGMFLSIPVMAVAKILLTRVRP